jgi:hypothetical protein
MKSLLPISIRDEHYETLAELLEEFFTLEVWQPLVPMLIDTVPAEGLTHLAEFFSVLGADGWEYVATEAEKRALLKQAVELHRHKGTPWAVRTSVEQAGFGEVLIEEGFGNFTHQMASIDYGKPLLYDGFAAYDGTFDFGSGVGGNARLLLDSPAIQWALFRVVVILAESERVSAAIVERCRAVINAYKNERSWLTDLGFVSRTSDSVPILPISEIAPRISAPDEFFDWAARYDGEYAYNNAITYGTANGLTDTPDDEAAAQVFFNGDFFYDGAIYYSGNDNTPRLRFPMIANIGTSETLTMTETATILINP